MINARPCIQDVEDTKANLFKVEYLNSLIESEMTYKRRKYHQGDTHLKKAWRTKRRTKDLDEINEDIKDANAKVLLNQKIDFDKPGAAQHYCIHCARYFIDNKALLDHFTTKVHKRRLKALELEPYTIEDSERAAGKGNYVPPKKRKIETQPEKDADKIEIDCEDTEPAVKLSKTEA